MRLAIVFLLASTISALGAPYVSSDGHEYDLTCTADGYQLKSLYPVARIVGQGAGSRALSGRETLALGRSCDAFIKLFGYGDWCWANGGFRANFGGDRTISFPRQELFCPTPRNYESQCRCQ